MDEDNIYERIMEHIKIVAVQIGPRGPTSENEKRASQYIQSIFERNVQEVIVDDFSSPSTFSWYYAVPCFVVFISFAVFLFHPLTAFIVSLLGSFFFIMEINTKETISYLFPKGRSQNVIARIKPEKAAANTVVIVAHHDTSKPSISFHPKLIRYFRASIILMIFSVLCIPTIYGLIILFSMDWIFFYISLFFSFYLLISVLVLIHRELAYKHIGGANDNASGVGVLLGLSEALSSSKPHNTEVWLLSTGCEEVGTVGMIRFLKRYGKELSDAYFICIDNVGKGLIRYTEAEGLIKTYKCSEKLVERVKISSLNLNIDAKAFVCRIYPTNALPCLVRGYEVISILSTDEKGLIHNWHWETDTIENLDAITINNAFDLVLDMVKSMDVGIQ